MADKSAIEWTDATWNPIVGCSIVSPGCTNCYAMKMAARLEAMGQAIYGGTTQRSKAGSVWTGKVALNRRALYKPIDWRKPRKIFVNSMSDLFHPDLDDDDRDICFATMGVADQHEYQVLTKRPHVAARYLFSQYRVDDIYAQWSGVSGSPPEMQSWPMRHVLIGCSVEDQARANERRGSMRAIAAAGWRTFVSYEPALGPVDWSGWEFLSWMISGGESGHGARPSRPDWHRSTRDWCAAAGVPFFFKQWGEWLPGEANRGQFDERPMHAYRRCDNHSYDWPRHGETQNFGTHEDHFSGDLTAKRVGKKAAGRLLDGKEHNEFPTRAEAS